MNNQEKQKEELLSLLQGIDNQQPHKSTEDRARRKEGLSSLDRKSQRDTRSDREILQQCQDKDKEAAKHAFQYLVQRYQNTVYTYAKLMVDDETAFEITRNVFVQAYRNLERIGSDTSLKVWFLTLAKRHLLKAARKRGKWYLRLLPLSLYQWYQQSGTDEQIEEAMQPGEKECHDIQNLLSAYIDDELNPSETNRVETHLATCPQCAQKYDDLLETVEMIHPSELIAAPANLQHAVNAILDKETLWERCLNYYEKFVGIFRFPVPQIAVAVASIALIFFGIAYYSQREQIRQMEAELRATRGLISTHPEITLNTFVIFTGRIVSEEMPLEAGEYVPGIIPEPEKAEIWFIAGNITDTGDKITEYIRSIQGKITADQGFTQNSLTIRKINAELPEHSNLILSLFFQQLEQKPPEAGESSDMSKTSIDIYIIDKL